jgi:tetratricopeptide (TPR) repeat protein
LLWREVRIDGQLLQRWTSSHLTPRAAVRYLDRLGPPQRILNQYNWGGYLIFAGDGAKVFIDERANTLYDETIYLDYLGVARDGRDPATSLAAYPAADAALAPRQSGLARTLQALSPPWRPIYRDARSVILAPPGSELLATRHPDPAAVLGDEPDVKVALARQAMQRGDLDAAERLIRFAIQLDPLMRRNYAELAGLQARRGDTEAAARTMEAAIRENPRQRKRLRLLESQVWLEVGDVERALRVLRRAVPTGPFVPRQAVLERIEMLERRVQQP